MWRKWTKASGRQTVTKPTACCPVSGDEDVLPRDLLRKLVGAPARRPRLDLLLAGGEQPGAWSARRSPAPCVRQWAGSGAHGPWPALLAMAVWRTRPSRWRQGCARTKPARAATATRLAKPTRLASGDGEPVAADLVQHHAQRPGESHAPQKHRQGLLADQDDRRRQSAAAAGSGAGSTSQSAT